MAKPENLSRRERQIMDVVWNRGSASAMEVHQALEDAPSYSAVRALLGILAQKGHLAYRRLGRRYVYEPTVSPAKARKHALARLLDTFFDNSAARLVETLLNSKERSLSPDELAEIETLISSHREEQRKQP